MSFANEDGTPDGLEQLKPSPKKVNNEVLDFIGKYRTDLNFLVTAKQDIEKTLADNNINKDEINQKLSRLNKSIVKLQDMIEEFENNHKDEL